MTAWKMVTGEDGNQYLEFNGQVMVSPDTMSNADGVVMMAPTPGQSYTLESISAMRSQLWDTRTVGPVLNKNDPMPSVGFGFSSGGVLPQATVKQWVSGDPPRGSAESERHPAGRFQNLDWEEAS